MAAPPETRSAAPNDQGRGGASEKSGRTQQVASATRQPHGNPPPLALQRAAEHLHPLGPRAVAELLDELRRAYSLDHDLDRRLTAYGRLNPDVVEALGAHRFPVRVWEVRP